MAQNYGLVALNLLLPLAISVLRAMGAAMTPYSKHLALRIAAFRIENEIYTYRTKTGKYNTRRAKKKPPPGQVPLACLDRPLSWRIQADQHLTPLPSLPLPGISRPPGSSLFLRIQARLPTHLASPGQANDNANNSNQDTKEDEVRPSPFMPHP